MNETMERSNYTDGIEINLLDVVNLMLTNFYWLLIAGIVAAAATYCITSYAVTPKYQSSVSLYVYNSTDMSKYSGTINSSDLTASENLAQTYSVILSSNSVLDAVVADIHANYDVDDTLTRGALNSMTTIGIVKETQLIKITVTNENPYLACYLAESYAKVAPGQIVRVTKAGGVEIVDNAEIATSPCSPSVMKDTVLAFIGGAMAAAVVLLIIMLADNKIYLAADIEKISSMTILGQIPEIDSTSNNFKPYTLTVGGALQYEDEQ